MGKEAHAVLGRSFRPLAFGVVAGLVLAGALSVLSTGAEEITILHTNDVHGSFLSRKAEWRDDGREVGGVEALADRVRKIRGSGGNVLLLDAGDFMTGHPVCEVEVGGAKGGAMMEFFNALAYDAMALGNHELDVSQDNALALIAMADFPVLCSNVVRERDGAVFTGRAAGVVEAGGLRVGIIGAMTEDLFEVVSRDNTTGLGLLPTLETVQSLADSLDPITDLVLVLSHMGVGEDRRLAEKVRGVDVIVGGHSHTRLTEPEKVGDVLIVQAGSRLSQLGRLDLTVRDDRVVEWSGGLIDLWIDEMTPQPDMRASAEHFEKLALDAFGEVLGTLEVPWQRTGNRESNIGNWITDAMRASTGADFAVINSGGLRKNLVAGPVRHLDIYEVLPFGNEICRFTCSGEDLLGLMRTNALAQSEGSHGILQVSGIRYAFRPVAGGVELVEALVAGEPVDPEKDYSGVSVDFVVRSQAEKYLGFLPREVQPLGIVADELVAQAVRKAGVITDGPGGRMRRLP